MRVALCQMNSSDDPAENCETLEAMLGAAAEGGADWALTPEVTNCLSASGTRQRDVLVGEAEDKVLAKAREVAAARAMPVLLGSIALAPESPEDGRFHNRSFLIDGAGAILARYDKIHMFDVEISETETYRESAKYKPGNKAVLADVAGTKVGLTICYDLRFPSLFRRLAAARAEILTVPSAFSPVTGRAHWETLLRARAIETGCFVLAPAQTGRHAARRGRARETHGHSLAVDPWGQVLIDGGTEPGVKFVDLDLDRVAAVRKQVPSLYHSRDFDGP
ncbi:MAG: carbon-nitrogen hydrolase family protein [Pseudomonadota bacterium]